MKLKFLLSAFCLLLCFGPAFAQFTTNTPSRRTNLNETASLDVTLRGDRLIIGRGSNAVTLSVTNGDTISLPMKWLVNEVEAAAVTVNGDRITSWQSIFSTNIYSGLVNTPVVPLITSNNVGMSGTNRIILGTVPTFTSSSITGYTNAYSSGSIPPLPNYQIQVSTNDGVDWFVPETTVIVTNLVSLYDANGASAASGGGSIVIYGYTTPDFIGNEVDLAGQTIFVDDPTQARAAANLTTAQAEAASAAALWATHRATTRPNIAGWGLAFDSTWSATHVSVSNETRLALGPYGGNLMTLIANHVTDTNALGQLRITNSYPSGTNLVLEVAAQNVVAALVPQYVTNVTATNWTDVGSYTSTWPLATNGLFKLTFPASPNTNTFYRVRSSIQTNGQYRVERKLLINGTLTLNATNTAPSNTSAPTHWGLLSVDGMTNQFKIPLYQ